MLLRSAAYWPLWHLRGGGGGAFSAGESKQIIVNVLKQLRTGLNHGPGACGYTDNIILPEAGEQGDVFFDIGRCECFNIPDEAQTFLACLPLVNLILNSSQRSTQGADGGVYFAVRGNLISFKFAFGDGKILQEIRGAGIDLIGFSDFRIPVGVETEQIVILQAVTAVGAVFDTQLGIQELVIENFLDDLQAAVISVKPGCLKIHGGNVIDDISARDDGTVSGGLRQHRGVIK